MEYQAAQKPEYQNMEAVAKIWGAFLFQRMTDLYGNVPYTEAGYGFRQNIYKPKYDTQESIYADLIDQLKEGISLLNADKPAIEGDLFYNGDIDQWKKFGNSLLQYQNMQAVAKIWGAFLFQRMTDLYGNVPYTEAGYGFRQNIYKPKYDTKESIYSDFIDNVKEGISLLNADKPAIEGDLLYNGDIYQWKKFGNSLLLRLGMRLSKVKPD